MTAAYEVRDGVAVITLENPPVNGLGYSTRKGVADGLSRAVSDDKVKAVVLTGAGKAFSAGADINEFGTENAYRQPDLPAVIVMVENSSKPVVAAMHTMAMGGGLELALACHYRLASAETKVALPEVKLGLLPGAGGTQRLPRAIGVEPALNMVLSGEPIEARMLAMLPGQKLFDEVVTEADGLMDKALAFARSVADVKELPRLRDLPARHPQAEAFFQFARNTAGAMSKNLPAPLSCVDAVEAAVTLPFDKGLARERELFGALMATPQSRSLRHFFFAERAAPKIDDLPADTPTRKIEKIAVIGAGTMGGGIAMSFLNAGIPVQLLETSQEAMDRGLATIRRNYEDRVRKGKLKQDKYEQTMALLSPTLDYADIADVDLVIEAVYEEMDVKEKVFRKLDEVLKPGAILASNTSTLDLDRIASFTSRPADVVGMHFFSPANVMKLLEVVRGEKTGKDVLATVMALARRIRKVAVVAGVTDGFIGNRMIDKYSRQASYLIDEGATPQQVDRAIEKFGFAMGPFRMADMAGNDIGWAIRKRRAAEQPGEMKKTPADVLCEQGRFGQKTGAGWYDYKPGKREPIVSREVEELIVRHREASGITPRKISDEEIVERLVFALVNEGARIVEEGFAQRASDIDVVYIYGYGFPFWRGGPMQYANERGLYNVMESMKRYGRSKRGDAAFWQPARLVSELAGENRQFR